MRVRWSAFLSGGAAVLAASGLALAQPLPPTGKSDAQVQYSPPPAVDPAPAQAQGALTPAEVRELLDAMRETAKATREEVDYTRVMPDLLTQILAKLDKLENKLDKIEDVLRAPAPRRR